MEPKSLKVCQNWKHKNKIKFTSLLAGASAGLFWWSLLTKQNLAGKHNQVRSTSASKTQQIGHWEAKQKENMYLPSYPKQPKAPPQGTVIISNTFNEKGIFTYHSDPYVIQNLLFCGKQTKF